MKALIFADVETTGLNAKTGFILEVGLLAVELPTFSPLARFTQVVRPLNWPTVRRNLHERVRAMHEPTGLLDAVEALPGPNTADVERAGAAFIQQWAPKTATWETPMAGANPRFDRDWLEEHMPKVASKFHGHRHFEVRTITFLQEWILGEAFVESPHRALADCEQAAAMVRAFLGLA